MGRAAARHASPAGAAQPYRRLYYAISAKSAEVVVYFTDRVIEELGRIGENQMTMGWPAARLARADDEDDEL